MISSLMLLVALAEVAASGPPQTIDGFVESAARRDGIRLTDPVDNDTYLRRVTLDLVGRIPSQAELLAFRASPDRELAVERLLNSEAFPVFWSRVWTSTLVGYGQVQQSDREALRAWLESCFAENRPIDDVVYDLLTAEGRAAFDGPANFILRHASDPVVPVGRIFLGVQLDCARCHDHPTDRWTQEDFEGMERFFDLVQRSQPIPGTYAVSDRQPAAQANAPRFLTGSKPRTGRWRQELGLFVVRSKPFARAMANRIWYHFFGHGVANPPDAVNGSDKSIDLDFINHLADSLKENDFRARSLIKSICLSRAYQRKTSTSAPDWTLIPTAKPMTPDQLYDSLLLALDQQDTPRRRKEFTRAAANGSLDSTFVESWSNVEQTQSLMTRLNLPLPNQHLSHREMFVRTLSREPTAQQLEMCRGHTTKEVMFALIHSNEFCFWH